MPSTTRTTADGYEMIFGVNVLANYLMLRLLLTRFAAPSRLIITGSVSHFADFRHNLGVVPRPNWTDTETIATPGSGPAANSAREGQRATARDTAGSSSTVKIAARAPSACSVCVLMPAYQSCRSMIYSTFTRPITALRLD
jgi:NAD(P)-dependent dehydrogenase (short-subunit alcohol dehydrogenase family)